MSAARAAARNKPVLVVKAGRAPEGAKAAASHTGALAGADDVYDAAIQRAGMLRVYSTEDLFDAAETLSRAHPFRGDRLMIMTNGGGPGVLAADAVALGNGHLTALCPDTLRQLDEILPASWSRGNPIDIIGDAPVERYVETLKVLQRDPDTDAILFIHAPTAIVPSAQIAEALAQVVSQSPRNVFACWLGEDTVAQARKIFRNAGIPTYGTPEQAVRAFLDVVSYRHNQDLLMETPPSAPVEFVPDVDKAKAWVKNALSSNRRVLTEPESKAVLAAYGVPIVKTHVANTPEGAASIAEEMGFPVAVKILSPDIIHKSDVGGVVLDLDSPNAVRAAAQAMQRRLRELLPDAALTGFTVQAMARRPRAFELIIGVASDPVFGPVILFGQGGTAVEVIGDHAIALPPLNLNLAKEVISRTRIAKLLAGYRDRPPANHDAINLALMQVSQLVCDIPEIVELDINPLIADETGVLALDARIRIAPAVLSGHGRLAIRPYPKEQEEWFDWNGMRVLLRPIRPEDEHQHSEFFSALTPEDIHFRFFSMIRQPAHSQLARMTQIDYDREMTFIAVARDEHGQDQTLGEARAVFDPDNVTAEFAIIVRSDLKERGLGTILLKKVIRYCREHGTQELVGEVLAKNTRMLNLARELGFVVQTPVDGVARLRLVL
jgi:acetyltransferase